MENSSNKNLLFRIGLGKKSGNLISGTDLVCDGVREHVVLRVLVAGDASENSKKRIRNCAENYKVDISILENVTASELGCAIGKSPVACVGITDKKIEKLILKGI